MENKKCPKCMSRYTKEERKETVSYLIDQPTVFIDYRMRYCPVCNYKECYKI